MGKKGNFESLKFFFFDNNFVKYFCIRINWRLITCCAVVDVRKILKACLMLVFVFRPFFCD